MVSFPGPGAVIAGKYELERPLARGGMGSVWVGRHRDLDIPVAIKLMAPGLIASADARARFEREAKAAAQLDSRHVVHVYDYGVDDGSPYIVMEFLKGEDLGHRLSRERRLPLLAVAEIVGQIAKALRKAHEMSLVHRDLKPANIFLALKDDEEICKVLDFGIAKATGTGLAGPATQTGALIGSVHFMSPEQTRRSKDVDFRTDLWALGVIAYRALTGRLPFAGDEIGDVIVKICTEPAAPPSTLAPGLLPEIDAFFARALCRAPDGRFQSAREMAQALAEVAHLPAERLSALPAPAPAPPAPALPLAAPGREVISGPTVKLEPLLEATAEAKTDVWHPATPPGDGSLSPAQQTLSPRPGKVRVLGAAAGLVLLVLLGVGWWTLAGGTRPSGAAATSSAATVTGKDTLSASAASMAPSAVSSATHVVSSAPVAPQAADVATESRAAEAPPRSTSTAAPGDPGSSPPTKPSVHPPKTPPVERRIPLP